MIWPSMIAVTGELHLMAWRPSLYNYIQHTLLIYSTLLKTNVDIENQGGCR